MHSAVVALTVFSGQGHYLHVFLSRLHAYAGVVSWLIRRLNAKRNWIAAVSVAQNASRLVSTKLRLPPEAASKTASTVFLCRAGSARNSGYALAFPLFLLLLPPWAVNTSRQPAPRGFSSAELFLCLKETTAARPGGKKAERCAVRAGKKDGSGFRAYL